MWERTTAKRGQAWAMTNGHWTLAGKRMGQGDSDGDRLGQNRKGGRGRLLGRDKVAEGERPRRWVGAAIGD